MSHHSRLAQWDRVLALLGEQATKVGEELAEDRGTGLKRYPSP